MLPSPTWLWRRTAAKSRPAPSAAAIAPRSTTNSSASNSCSAGTPFTAGSFRFTPDHRIHHATEAHVVAGGVQGFKALIGSARLQQTVAVGPAAENAARFAAGVVPEP